MVDETGLVERLDASIAELTARGSVLPPRIQEAVNAMDCARDALEALQQEVERLRAFTGSIVGRTPNGEWIAVQFHPDGDWSVAAAPNAPPSLREHERDLDRLLEEGRAAISAYRALQNGASNGR